MKSFILSVTSRIIIPVMLLFSLYLLLRGHDLPGGGFIGGLTAGVAFVLHGFAYGIERTEKLLKLNAINWIAIGLLLVMLTGLAGLMLGNAFLQGYWFPFEIPVFSALGTPLLFDIGVYVVVIGCTVLITFRLIK